MSLAAGLAVLVSAPHLGGCGVLHSGLDPVASTGSLPNGKRLAAVTLADRECLARAMYFESNRSSEEGLLAVGTVVINRLEAPAYPDSICGVVGQHRQFAAGVLHKPMREKEREKAEQVADAILSGQRHEGVGNAKFFHTAGLRFPYSNMHYVALAGGNAFYEKRSRHEREALPAPAQMALAPVQALPAPVHVARGRAPVPVTRVARTTGQTPLAELGPARNICRVAAAGAARTPG
ncbi:cell wall hydrolase [Methylobacterium nodulans]|uniref:Cell wall hydrolase SleB n=1 Tax=Methylobacterium nodulans (strain LMG 21967 / CNCM I-2342 / ORS 2060) TaxID=460265 RepID=B8IEW4_METNO|nr:cell wall hydrolase [Methylobacterium nodulans]ACL61457.1 cell wall hydrolase SleB [Methylobacterium nodulans ORS 2060]